MDENERSEEIGEVVPPAEDGSAEQRESVPTPQSHEDNRRFQAARLGGERAGYERAMRELAGRESERRSREEEQMRFIALRAAQARRESRAARSTGSGGSGVYEALNARQQSELDAWNRAFPQMKMSAREYLSRNK